MPMKISMAMAATSGAPECESFVTHCTLKFDDESLSLQDDEVLQQVVHLAIAACCQSVQEELRRH